MAKFNLVLELCHSFCKEVLPVSAEEAAKLDKIAIVRGVSCYFNPKIQNLAVQSTSENEFLANFKIYG